MSERYNKLKAYQYTSIYSDKQWNQTSQRSTLHQIGYNSVRYSLT